MGVNRRLSGRPRNLSWPFVTSATLALKSTADVIVFACAAIAFNTSYHRPNSVENPTAPPHLLLSPRYLSAFTPCG